jgi:hypothetical protein
MNSKEKRHERVGAGWAVFSMCVVVASLVLFNLFPHRVGSIRFSAGSLSFRPLLAPSFARYLPWLNIWWVAVLCLNGMQLVHRQRTLVMRVSGGVLDLLGACIVALMAVEPPVLPTVGLDASAASKLFVLLAVGLVLAAARRLRGLIGLRPVVIQWEQGEQADHSA